MIKGTDGHVREARLICGIREWNLRQFEQNIFRRLNMAGKSKTSFVKLL